MKPRVIVCVANRRPTTKLASCVGPVPWTRSILLTSTFINRLGSEPQLCCQWRTKLVAGSVLSDAILGESEARDIPSWLVKNVYALSDQRVPGTNRPTDRQTFWWLFFLLIAFAGLLNFIYFTFHFVPDYSPLSLAFLRLSL